MQLTGKRLLYWTPRIFSILFAVFIGLFALDVFSEEKGSWDIAVGFLIHIIPAVVIIGILVLSWRREWLGAIIYFAMAVFYIVSSRGKESPETYFFIAGPLIIIGVLFLLNWIMRPWIRKTGGSGSGPVNGTNIH